MPHPLRGADKEPERIEGENNEQNGREFADSNSRPVLPYPYSGERQGQQCVWP